MTKEEFIERIKDIGLLEDQADIRVKLTELSENIEPMFDKVDTLQKTTESQKADLEKLRETNMQLFLKVGSKTVDESNKEIGGEEEKEKLKYEDLFDENGNIK